jgi:hypothetical protein
MTIELRLLLRVRTASYTTALLLCLNGVHKDKFRLLPLTDCTYRYCWAIRGASSKATSDLWTASRGSVCEKLWGVQDSLRYPLRLPYILVKVCNDGVAVRTRIAYNNCAAILAHGFNSCDSPYLLVTACNKFHNVFG